VCVFVFNCSSHPFFNKRPKNMPKMQKTIKSIHGIQRNLPAKNRPILAPSDLTDPAGAIFVFSTLRRIYALFRQASAHLLLPTIHYGLATVSGGGVEAELNFIRLPSLLRRPVRAMIQHPSAELFRPVRPVGLVRLVGLYSHSFSNLRQKSTLYSCKPLPAIHYRLSTGLSRLLSSWQYEKCRLKK
jgi:hypothetical protein